MACSSSLASRIAHCLLFGEWLDTSLTLPTVCSLEQTQEKIVTRAVRLLVVLDVDLVEPPAETGSELYA
jgi:hypothetical protein